MSSLSSVSRETIGRLELYAALLVKWTPRINLVAKSTLEDLWNRHIEDSAQLFPLAPHPVAHWADLGSGGGFPGLVVAILGAEHDSPHTTTLIESDARKSAFLRTVIRETGVNASVITDRIENVPPLAADVVSMRALADLSTLLSHIHRHMAPHGTALVPKGERWKKELAEAQTRWNFEYRLATSKTEPGSVVLSITGVTRA